MGADDEADTAVDEVAERLFFAGRLGVEVDDHRVAPGAERVGRELLVGAAERVVERVHEYAPHEVDHEHIAHSAPL